MSSIDSRIVTMKFDNASFEQKAAASLSTIGKIKEALNFKTIASGATKSLSGITSMFSRFSIKNPFRPAQDGMNELNRSSQNLATTGLSTITGGVTSISSSFLAMSTIAITALSNITNKAIDAGTRLVKSFTLDPITAGFAEYELKMDSIQTILANTAKYGTKLPQVTAALDELNDYADKTIYNFGDMTKNIGLFTNSGMRLEEATSVIKGFSNAAAASGTSAQGAASAAYQLSQAFANGEVRLMDWKSLTNVGLGNDNMKNNIIDIADAMGTLDKAELTSKGVQEGFNESLEKGWLTADVMSNYLRIMAGDMSAAEQASLGLSKAQIDALAKTQKTAEDSATKVRTLSKLMSTLKEAAGSSFSETFDILFGDFNEATALFTNINNTIGGMLGKAGERRNDLIRGWDELGGRDKMIDALSNAFTALMRIVKPIRAAFSDIFPPQTAQSLYDLTVQFEEFTKKLIPSKATMQDIRSIAGGVFAVFSIIGQVLGGVVTGFKALFDTVGGGKGNFLDFAGGVGESIKSFNDFLKESGVIETFFIGLANVLAVPLAIIKSVGGALGAIFAGFNVGTADAVGGAIENVSNKLTGIQAVADAVGRFVGRIGGYFKSLGGVIGDSLGGVGDAIAGAFSANTFDKSLDIINTSLLGAIVLMIKSFFSNGISLDLTGGLFDGITETLGAATGALENMQASLKADILLKIGIAIAVLAASLLVLSTINPQALQKALLAMGAGFGLLVGTMAAMMKVLGPVGVIQIYAISSAMTKLAASMLLLSLALKVMASIKFGELIRGLGAMFVLLTIIQKAMIPLAAGSKGMVKAAASLILLGIALNILAVALKVFAAMSWEEMGKGLAGVAGTLVVLAGAMRLMPKDMIKQAAAILILGVALNVLGVALKIFATMSWSEMLKGLVTLGGALLIIGLAMRAMPKNMLLQAVALNAVATALVVIGGALKVMGGMSVEQIAKGLGTLAGTMLILAIGLKAMSGSIGGAIALTVTAAALAVLLPQLIILGSLDWMTILKSLTMLAGIFVILGVAGAVLAPVTIVIIGLAAALLLIGAGLALAGAGALAFGTAFALVVATGTAGAQMMAQFLGTLIAAIPPALAAFGQGIVEFAAAIGRGAPKIAAAFGKILTNILNAVIRNAPKLAQAFGAMLNAGLTVLVNAIPRIADAGLRIILGFLKAVDSHVSDIADTATSIIVKFLAAIGRNLPKIIDAGQKMIIEFIRGTAAAIRANSDDMGAAGADLGFAIIEGLAGAIAGGAGVIKGKLVDIARDALNAAKDFLNIGGPSGTFRDEVGRYIPEGIIEGVDRYAPDLNRSMTKMGSGALETLRASLSGVSEALTLDPNMSPTVTPVLDLSQMSREATRISSILATTPIIPTVSYETASSISAETQARRIDGLEAAEAEGSGGDTYVTYEQHLHSPKAIDRVDVYRDTKSLISLRKDDL